MRSLMKVTAIVLIAVLATTVGALPASKARLQSMEQMNGGPAASSVPVPAAPVAPAAPALAGSFHTAYWISALKPNIPFMPGLSRVISRVTELLEGECWQNTDTATGLITIKTTTQPSFIGRLLVPTTTSVWVRDHGWTWDARKKQCTKDLKLSQLYIPGDILTKTGIFKGKQKIQPMVKVSTPKPDNADGTYNVDVWDATLPNGEGTVTYYLLSSAKTPTPILSNYRLAGKPSAWAQYKFFIPGLNDAKNYDPQPECFRVSLKSA